MEDVSKIIEEKNKKMSFSEYKAKTEKNKPKETKFGKFISTLVFWPIKGFISFFGINKNSLTPGGSSSPSYGGGNAWKASQRVNHTPTPPSFNPEAELIREIRADAYHEAAGFKKGHDCDCDHSK